MHHRTIEVPLLLSGGSRAGALLGLFVLLFATQACTPQAPSGAPARAFHGETMGTTYTVKVLDDGRASDELDLLKLLIQAELDDVDNKMSTYRQDSELSRFNGFEDTTPFAVSPETFEVFRLAEQVSDASNGAFDVTVGPLVNLWGFGPDDRGSKPEQGDLEALRDRIGYQLVELDESGPSLRKQIPEVSADLSAIAKGYGVDRVAAMLIEQGVGNFMVEVGGEIRTRGSNDQGGPWQLAIERPDPDRRAIHRVISLSDAALATSGDYRNFYLEDGVRVSHTVDPRTLSPVRHTLVSASVIHDSCAAADAWATALMVLGPDEGIGLAESRGLAVLLLVSSADGLEERMTQAFREKAAVRE